MKKYLFGLGAMLVGARLMFVLMQGEVNADSKPKKLEAFACSEGTGAWVKEWNKDLQEYTLELRNVVQNCRVDGSKCGITAGGISCLKG